MQEQTAHEEKICDGGIGMPLGGNICTLSVIGQIEGHYLLPPDSKTTKYEHVIPQLAAAEQDAGIDGLLILINTVGGDVEAGLAIAELIAGMRTVTASVVLGGGHSIGVPLAVSADRSFIVPSAAMTVHPVRLSGPVLGTPQTVSYFARMQQRIDGFLLRHSHISKDRLHELMFATDDIAADVGTVIDGETAVDCGLIDAIGSISDALDWINGEIEIGRNKKENHTDQKEQQAGG